MKPSRGNEPAPDRTYTAEERIALKYDLLREKIISSFQRGSRILKITKIVATVFFLLFTLAGIGISHRTGHEIQWLQAWILLIFFNVIVFVLADYAKYLVEDKVIPYLEDDEQVEFGEYDIFLEDNDDEEEDDEEEEA
ncbi:MAG: hypothetical protein IJ168_02465 [Eubacterium sp.]|nr:hypothetical protein [Eubacterium sp.]